ncbi:MAG TPA: DinB family protein [Gemmatimonadales bacterium]|nr:DinB family protein [Gemmatimonadales bacterium]
MPIDATATLLSAYSASARINQYLVERLHPSLWRVKVPGAKVRTIAALVAHVHNCGLVYLRRAAPKVPVPPELDRFSVTQKEAARVLGAKRKAVLRIVTQCLREERRLDGWSSGNAAMFLAYYMSHDAHHRGQIVTLARLLGHPISTKTMSGMWQWGVRSRE